MELLENDNQLPHVKQSNKDRKEQEDLVAQKTAEAAKAGVAQNVMATTLKTVNDNFILNMEAKMQWFFATLAAEFAKGQKNQAKNDVAQAKIEVAKYESVTKALANKNAPSEENFTPENISKPI